jgi:DNA (cytosine-5)-methyltransferase 1
LTVLSLFSGIGGLDLGIRLAVTDARVIAYVEKDAYCRRVLKARMADGVMDEAPLYEDVTTFDGTAFRGTDLICGGFPCQDISNAGRREGITGSRSGLWSEFARIIGEVGPRYVFVENVSALLGRGMGRVCGDLSSLGFDQEWGPFSAADVGAPHLRKRIFILAYARHQPGAAEPREQHEVQAEVTPGAGRGPAMGQSPGQGRGWAEPAGEALGRSEAARGLQPGRPSGSALADAGSGSSELRTAQGERLGRPASGNGKLGHAEPPLFPPGPADRDGWAELLRDYPGLAPALTEEEAERMFRGVPHGFPPGVHRRRSKKRVARLRCLGNAVVPACSALAWITLAARIAGAEKGEEAR